METHVYRPVVLKQGGGVSQGGGVAISAVKIFIVLISRADALKFLRNGKLSTSLNFIIQYKGLTINQYCKH